MRLFVLVNPRSGNGAGEALGRALSAHGQVHPICFDQLDAQLAEARSFDCIVVGGGDGTISSVLTSPTLPDRPVLPIALGTANDLARDLGILRALKGIPWEAIPVVTGSWMSRPFATWQLTFDGLTIPFSNYCSLGFEGATVADFHNWRAQSSSSGRARNRIMYTFFGLRHLSSRLRGLEVSCDSSAVKLERACMSLIFTNIRSYLGLGLSNATGSPADKKLECITTGSVLDYARFIGASSGLVSPPAALCSGSTISVHSIPPQTPLQVDGEAKQPILGGRLQITLRKVISILAPPEQTFVGTTHASTADGCASHR